MNKIWQKKERTLLVACAAFVSLFLSITLMTAPTSAGSEGGGGNTVAGCKGKSAVFTIYSNQYSATSTCEWAGWGWMYFAAQDGFSGDVQFYPASDASGGIKTIPSVCADVGGFWHVGYFQVKHLSYGTATMDGLGQVGNPKYSHAGGLSNRVINSGWRSSFNSMSWGEITKNTVSHLLVSGGRVAYAATCVGSETEDNSGRCGPNVSGSVRENYEAWRASDYASGFTQTWDAGYDSGTISYFCYGPGVDQGGFSGEITARINGVPVANGSTFPLPEGTTSVNIDYVDTVTRRNDNTDYPSVTIWYKGDDDSNHTTQYTKTGVSMSKGSKSVTPITATDVPVNTTICHTLEYPIKVTESGEVTYSRKTTHCVRPVVTTTPPPPTTGACAEMGISGWNRYNGWTDARLDFKLNGTTYKLGRGQTASSKTVWAKPGDNVKYTYHFCGSTEEPRYAENTLPFKANGYTVDPSFVISGTARHLFDLSKTSFSASDLDGNYGYTITSPQQNIYTCSIPGGASKAANHFQIPAAGVTDNCYSVEVTGTEVGKSFYQQVSYRKLTVGSYQETWYRRSDHGWWTTVCGNVSDGNGGTTYTCWDRWHAHWTDVPYPVYGAEVKSGSNPTLKGTVNVPYNYELVPYTKRFGHTDGVVYAGSKFNTTSYIATLTRKNEDVGGGAYATHTPQVDIIIASFTTNDNLGSKKLEGSTGTGGITADKICRSFSVNVESGSCKTEYSTQTELNKHSGQLTGAKNENRGINSGDGSGVNGILSINVPIVPPGKKLCVAIGVSHAVSHDSAQQHGMGLSNTYKIGPAACVTVAKKPSFSVESGDFYVNGDIKTSTSTVETGTYGTRVFGSWSEYGLIAGAAVQNFGSGAAYGYKNTPYTSTNHDYAGDSDNRFKTGIINTGAAGGNGGLPSGTTSDCSFSRQTYGGEGCYTGLQGYGTALMRASNINNLIARIKKIYYKTPAQLNSGYQDSFGVRDLSAKATSKLKHAETGEQITIKEIDISGDKYTPMYQIGGTEGACQYDSTLGRYKGDTSSRLVYTKSIDNNGNVTGGGSWVPSVYCTSDGNKYHRASGNMIITTGIKSVFTSVQMGGAGTSDLDHEGNIVKDSYRNPVYVYDIKGKLIIDGNIITYNGNKGDNFESLDQIPTVIIFADDVIISDRTNRIDAWIITPGNLNTCGVDTTNMSSNYYDAYGYKDGVRYRYPIPTGNITGLTYITPDNLNSNKCDTELIINGSVYAGSLTLNRTYGGGAYSNGDVASFIKRGEIFNQRADVFYWSYYQAQRSRVMTTVYSRELPTRY